MQNDKKINVGVFSDVYYPMIDGVVKVMESHVKHLKDRVNFYLIVPGAPKDYEEKSIGEKKIIRTKSVKIFFLDYVMPVPKFDCKLKPQLKDIDLDLVIIHSPFGIGRFGIRWARKNNIPSIIYGHSQLKQDFKRAAKLHSITWLLTRRAIRMYNRASMVVPVGEGVKKVYIKDYKLKNRTTVIQNATDLELLDNDQLINEIKEKHGVKDGEYVFSFVGRINKLKGIYLIADALKIAKDHGVKFKMFFIGDGLDLPKLQSHCKKIGIEDEMVFVGSISNRTEMAAYYQSSDLFLFPSMYDTNSLVQKEAASQKTPSLFVNGSITSYGLQEGVHGFFADNNPESFAKKIIELTKDPKTLKDIRPIIYEHAYWTWDDSANKLYDLMIELINENKEK